MLPTQSKCMPLVLALSIAVAISVPASVADTAASGSTQPPAVAERKSDDRTPVPEGINDNFLNPDLDPDEWLKRFEVESREVFAGRAEIMKVLNLQPGQRIADVGSGTGLYVAPFSRAVGEQGTVFAIDISPRLIEFIGDRIKKEGLDNVTVIRSTEKSITLPADAVDRVFICDTYHHFTYHKAMLASIRKAMKPDAELILLDFERIPGKSREFILGHVRAGKEVVQGEVEAAGFELIEEVKVPQFEENYLLRFRLRNDR